PVTLAYVWKVNGTVVAGATGPIFDLSTAGHGDHGDAVSVTVTPNDGTANGAAATDTATVANTAPAADVAPAAPRPRTDDTLSATTTKTDADGDPVTLAYVWKLNGTVVAGATGATLDLSTAGHGDKGDAISATVTPNDGAAIGAAVTDTATVANSAPVVDS